MHYRFRFAFLGLCLFAALSFLVFPPSIVQANHRPWHQPFFSIYVEGKPVSFDVEPYLEQERLMVPMRSLLTALGASIDYNAETNVATVTRAGTKLVFDFNNGSVVKDGKPLEVSPRPKVVNDRTMVPLRFVSETFGLPVSWDPLTNIVRIGPSAETQQKWNPIRDTFTKSRAAMNSLDSFTAKADYEIHAQIPYSLSKVDISGDVALTYHVNPVALHLQTSPGDTSSFSDAFSKQLVKFWDMYIQNGNLYYKDAFDFNKWKSESLSKSQKEDLQKPFETYLTDQTIEQILPYSTLQEVNGQPQILIEYTGDDIRSMDKAKSAQQGYHSSETSELMMPQSIKLTLQFDKATFRLLESTIEIQLFEVVPYYGKSTIRLENFNNAPDIVVPAEALQANQASK